jgi:hypothetical protein
LAAGADRAINSILNRGIFYQIRSVCGVAGSGYVWSAASTVSSACACNPSGAQ